MPWWIPWGAFLVFLLVFPVPRFLNWWTSTFAVTSDRVVHRYGWISKYSMEIPLEAINDVRFEQGVIDRMVGAGSLLISSASTTGTNRFEDIRHPEDVQKTIAHQGELNKQRLYRGMGTQGGPTPVAAGERRVAVDHDRARAARQAPGRRRPHRGGVPGPEGEDPGAGLTGR